MRRNRTVALLLALFMLLAPLGDSLKTIAALAEAAGEPLTAPAPEESAAALTSLTPDATQTPEPTETPKPGDTPEPTETPEPSDMPEASSDPEETETPESAPDPADLQENSEPILMTVRRGIVFMMPRGTEEALKKTLGVTVEWVDDGGSHTNNLILE